MFPDYPRMQAHLRGAGLSAWSDRLAVQLEDYFRLNRHGDFDDWHDAVKALPAVTPEQVVLEEPVVRIGSGNEIDEVARGHMERQLRRLMPWRKGPFSFFGVEIDAEWRSDMKWSRLSEITASLRDRRILDVGCGNGYYGWRMLGEGASLVIGTDPTLRFIMQFQAAKKYLEDKPLYVLPFGLEALDVDLLSFDTVFSMGVIYHRKDTAAHLSALFRCLRGGGELVLESLVVDGDYSSLLVPDGRYAKMNNVWRIPSCLTLQNWIRDAGFGDVQLVDVSTTRVDEQRATDWMMFESLADFLDPADLSKTIEGYPAPRRAIFTAQKP